MDAHKITLLQIYLSITGDQTSLFLSITNYFYINMFINFELILVQLSLAERVHQ